MPRTVNNPYMRQPPVLQLGRTRVPAAAWGTIAAFVALGIAWWLR